jgi:hypothetical protein
MPSLPGEDFVSLLRSFVLSDTLANGLIVDTVIHNQDSSVNKGVKALSRIVMVCETLSLE